MVLTAHLPRLSIRDRTKWVPTQLCVSNTRIYSVTSPLPLKLILPKSVLPPGFPAFCTQE